MKQIAIYIDLAIEVWTHKINFKETTFETILGINNRLIRVSTGTLFSEILFFGS